MTVHRLTIHAIVFLAVSTLLVFLWLVWGSSGAGLSDVIADPTGARDLGFWPIWVIAPWVTVVVIHAGITGANAIRDGRAVEEPPSAGVEDGLRRTAVAAGGLLNAALERGAAALGPDDEEAVVEPGVGRSRWVAVMFTDIADSTARTEELGDRAWHKVLTRHRKVIRRCIAEHHGEEVATQGDGFFIRHDGATDAVACAVAIQRRLARRRYRDLPPVRIGIHAGDAVQDHDGDLTGRVVNVAARVTDAAGDGEILVTEAVADAAPADVRLVDEGLRDLKGVGQPRHLLQVDW